MFTYITLSGLSSPGPFLKVWVIDRSVSSPIVIEVKLLVALKSTPDIGTWLRGIYETVEALYRLTKVEEQPVRRS